MMKKFITVFLCMVVLFTSGFGGVGTASAADAVTGLYLSQKVVSIEQGDSITLTATASYDSGKTENVTTKANWRINPPNDSNVANVVLGKITGEKTGKTIIEAEYQGIRTSVEVEVLKKVKSIVKSEQSLDIRSGGQGTQVTLDAYFEDGSEKENVTNKATWTSDNELIATVINGKIVGHSSGSAVITAKYGKHSTTIPVNVDIVKRLEPSKSKFSFLLKDKNSEEIQLLATFPDNAKPEDVADKAEWSSDNAAVADYINGEIVAYSAGKATLTAKFGTKTATIQVEVDASMKLELDKQSLFMKTTETTPQKLTLTAYYAAEVTPTDPKIEIKTEIVTDKAEWSSSDPSVASVTKGYVSALKTGEAVITAKYGDKSVSITVDVEVPRRLEVDNDYISISAKDKTNNKKQLAVSAYFANGTKDDVTSKAEWTSSNDSVASVSKGGLLTANKAGEATITAKYAGKTVTIQVDVDIPRKLTFGVSSLELQVGGVYDLKLSAIYGDKDEDVTALAEWSTSSATVAEVRKGQITGVSTGTATITAKYGNRTVTIPVSVGIVKGLTVTKGAEEKVEKLVMKKGDSVNLKLWVNYTAEGKSEDVTKLATWKPTESKVAQVDSDGMVKAIGSGKENITAKFGDKTITIPVEVDVADSLTADKRFIFMRVGETADVLLNASPYVTQQAVWSSSSSSVADVVGGKITAYKNGKTTITAKYGGKSVSIQVEVDVIEKLEANTRVVRLKTVSDSSADKQFEVVLKAYLSSGQSIDVTKDAEWKVSSYKVADVSDGLITAVSYGKTSVTAKYGGKSVTIPVEVDQLKYLKTDIVKLEMKPGDTKPVVAIATYLDGKDENVSVPALWTTSKLQVADVKDGVIKAHGPGRATITVKFGGKTTQVIVNVSK
jgi:uncharacterized protein YjdB